MNVRAIEDVCKFVFARQKVLDTFSLYIYTQNGSIIWSFASMVVWYKLQMLNKLSCGWRLVATFDKTSIYSFIWRPIRNDHKSRDIKLRWDEKPGPYLHWYWVWVYYGKKSCPWPAKLDFDQSQLRTGRRTRVEVEFDKTSNNSQHMIIYQIAQTYSYSYARPSDQRYEATFERYFNCHSTFICCWKTFAHNFYHSPPLANRDQVYRSN